MSLFCGYGHGVSTGCYKNTDEIAQFMKQLIYLKVKSDILVVILIFAALDKYKEELQICRPVKKSQVQVHWFAYLLTFNNISCSGCKGQSVHTLISAIWVSMNVTLDSKKHEVRGTD